MPRRSYSLEFKQSAARIVREQGHSLKKAADSLGVDPGSIRDWVRKFAPEEAAATDGASADGLRRKLDRLRSENKLLLIARDVLNMTGRQSLFDRK